MMIQEMKVNNESCLKLGTSIYFNRPMFRNKIVALGGKGYTMMTIKNDKTNKDPLRRNYQQIEINMTFQI